ncbi:MAG TPA: LysR family transcriptional regulator [Novosphingobium sp.]
MKITLRQLEVFDAVATLGSLSSAADRLGMSQSAASSAISDLQVVLGRPLFAHAKGRALQITDEGRRLQSTVRSVLSKVQDMETAQDAPIGGKLVIGATTMIADAVLAPICVEFLKLHPDVQLRIESASSMDLFERLMRFELETALVENFPEVDGFELTVWRSDELWLVVGPTHPLAQRGRMRIEDLAGARWCSREQRSTTASRLRWLLHEKLGQVPLAIESNSNEALRRASMMGAGIACLSSLLVRDDVAAGRLVRLDVSDFRFTRALSLARPRNMWRSRAAAAFDSFLLERSDREGGIPSASNPSEIPIGVYDELPIVRKLGAC